MAVKSFNEFVEIKRTNNIIDEDGNLMDFSDPIFQGKKGQHYKCSWAKKCFSPWEGIDSLCN